MPADHLDDLVEAVLAKPDYRYISVDLVRWIGRQELEKRRSLKEAVKQTRSRLHQIAAAYQPQDMQYNRWLDELSVLPHDMQNPRLRDFCLRIMAYHTSTRERMPILEEFFGQVLSHLHPLKSILDIGCGMNALALPWMPVASGVSYYGLDLFSDQAEFLNAFLAHVGVSGSVQVCNVLNGLPETLPHVQAAFLLKTLQNLEQMDKNISIRLIKEIQAETLVISYPVRSLGGRSKGMLQNYQNHFENLSEQFGWSSVRKEFITELAFIVDLKVKKTI